ncbi:Rubrerythrin [Caldanaerovirga acetigignens]|jgi:rubrerythrin|uniref:Rubrerythrin n=1 Tax=Caldanaerovirga acetigignens TaxID=447595 RepID=A0A1M7LG48_9FIRM|nr:ferritin family protein [Caldanaerovirga acetigignens]SHM77079.1 Rubrerythrin [Caldanaerovirga acetigignens]
MMEGEGVMHYDDGRATLLEMLREDLIGELQAINQYERHARMTNVTQARQLFLEIANDEKHHVAELMRMIMQLDRRQAEEMRKAFM